MELTTRRLLLRPLCDDDAHAMALSLNNLAVSRNLARVPYPYSLNSARDFINAQRGFDPRSRVCAIAFNCAPEELIGVISYEARGGNRFELGYWLNESCWGMRLMSEAASALVHHAFTLGGVGELVSGYHAGNENSGRILRRLGFSETGQEQGFSLARGCEVPLVKMKLAAAAWLAHQESRAA